MFLGDFVGINFIFSFCETAKNEKKFPNAGASTARRVYKTEKCQILVLFFIYFRVYKLYIVVWDWGVGGGRKYKTKLLFLFPFL